MNTVDLFIRLLRVDDTPPDLLQGAFAYATSTQAGEDTTDLCHLLACHPDSPAQVLTSLCRHPEVSVRGAALCHPALPSPERRAAVRSERAVAALTAVARSCRDAAALTLVADKACKSASRLTACKHLLSNPALDDADRLRVLIAADQCLSSALQPEDDPLLDFALDALHNYPHIARQAGPHLTYTRLLRDAAHADLLDEAGWERVRAMLMNPALDAVRDDTLTTDAATTLSFLMRAQASPGEVASEIAATILASSLTGPQAEDLYADARRAAAVRDESGAAAALLVDARSSDPVVLRRVGATASLPLEVLVELLTNPATPGRLLLSLLPGAALSTAQVVDVLRAHPDTVLLADLAWSIGPSLLPLVAQAAGDAVAGDVELAVVQRLAEEQRSSLGVQAWREHVRALSDARLESVPWPTLRALIAEDPRMAAWVASRFAALVGRPGAAVLFSRLQKTFTGPTGELAAALDGVSSEIAEAG